MTPTRYPAAPLDRVARVVTRAMWAMAAGLAVGGAVLATTSIGTGLVLVASGVGVAVLLLVFRPKRPLAYVVHDDQLEVVRAGAAPRVFEGPVHDVRRGSLGLRVAGDGGAYGYLGRYRADGSTVDAFVTDRAAVVLLGVGQRRIALSPADPEGFVEALGGGNA